jgi:hypothetical protein
MAQFPNPLKSADEIPDYLCSTFVFTIDSAIPDWLRQQNQRSYMVYGGRAINEHAKVHSAATAPSADWDVVFNTTLFGANLQDITISLASYVASRIGGSGENLWTKPPVIGAIKAGPDRFVVSLFDAYSESGFKIADVTQCHASITPHVGEMCDHIMHSVPFLGVNYAPIRMLLKETQAVLQVRTEMAARAVEQVRDEFGLGPDLNFDRALEPKERAIDEMFERLDAGLSAGQKRLSSEIREEMLSFSNYATNALREVRSAYADNLKVVRTRDRIVGLENMAARVDVDT